MRTIPASSLVGAPIRVPDEAAIEAAMPKARKVFCELARLLGAVCSIDFR